MNSSLINHKEVSVLLQVSRPFTTHPLCLSLAHSEPCQAENKRQSACARPCARAGSSRQGIFVIKPTRKWIGKNTDWFTHGCIGFIQETLRVKFFLKLLRSWRQLDIIYIHSDVFELKKVQSKGQSCSSKTTAHERATIHKAVSQTI